MNWLSRKLVVDFAAAFNFYSFIHVILISANQDSIPRERTALQKYNSSSLSIVLYIIVVVLHTYQ